MTSPRGAGSLRPPGNQLGRWKLNRWMPAPAASSTAAAATTATIGTSTPRRRRPPPDERVSISPAPSPGSPQDYPSLSDRIRRGSRRRGAAGCGGGRAGVGQLAVTGLVHDGVDDRRLAHDRPPHGRGRPPPLDQRRADGAVLLRPRAGDQAGAGERAAGLVAGGGGPGPRRTRRDGGAGADLRGRQP